MIYLFTWHTTFPLHCSRRAAHAGAQWQGESRVWRNQAGCSAPEFIPQLAHGQLHNEAMIPSKIEGLEENLGWKSTGGILSNFSKFWLYQPSAHLNANVFE